MGCRGCRRRLSPICCPASAPVVAHEEITITSIPCLLGVMWERVLTMMLRDMLAAVGAVGNAPPMAA